MHIFVFTKLRQEGPNYIHEMFQMITKQYSIGFAYFMRHAIFLKFKWYMARLVIIDGKTKN